VRIFRANKKKLSPLEPVPASNSFSFTIETSDYALDKIDLAILTVDTRDTGKVRCAARRHPNGHACHRVDPL